MRLFLKEPSKFMNRNPKYKDYDIGAYSYGFPEVFDSKTGKTLKIGKFCSFASNVTILLSDEHKISSISTFPLDVFWGNEKPFSKGDIIIGNDVWFGYGAIILSGVTIGDGAVVGAGTVVSHDVPAYAVVVGDPARIVKYRFEPEQIKQLLKIKWWNWSYIKIRQQQSLLMDVDGKNRLKEMLDSDTT